MACCENHDRLDKVLHTEEFIEMTCGSHKHRTVVTVGRENEKTFSKHPEGGTEPHYCCFNCPTLVADKKAS